MRIVALAFLLAVTAPTAFAQAPDLSGSPNEFRRFEIFYAPYSYARQGDLNIHGGELAFTTNINGRFAVVADLSGHFQNSSGDFLGMPVDGSLEVWSYRFGPRFTVHRTNRVSVFAHGLAGGTRLIVTNTLTDGTATFTSSAHTDGFSLALGGGVDVAWKRWLAFRVIQADFSLLHFGGLDTSGGLRLGAGVIFRFGH